MPIARIRFGRARKRDFDAADDAAHSYLAQLLKNGQVHEYFLSSAGGSFQACVEIPRRDSLERRHCSSWVAEYLKKAIEVFGRRPEVTFLDRAPAKAIPWKRAGSFYLSTSQFDRGSPVRSPDFEEPVPLYLLPLEPRDREWIFFWAEDYRAYDRIWLRSQALEVQAWREMADPHSDLARGGRKLCRIIEKATRKPTYYHLSRYYGHRSGEEKRPCPNCGRKWALGSSWADQGRHRFFFRCDRCRLVSHLGDVLDGERLARIGDFPGKPRRRR